MYECPNVPMTDFGVTGGVLSQEEKKKRNRARFYCLYLWDGNLSCLVGETILFLYHP